MTRHDATASLELALPSGQELAEEPARSWPALSHGQRSLWFLHHLAPVGGAYNIAAAARVLSPVDAGTLERAFQALVDRHAALRTTFPAVGGTPHREVAGHRDVALASLDVTGWSAERLRSQLAAEAWRPFDLERGPLLRVSLWTGDPGGPVILLAVHHIVADFWSLAILMRELPELYREAAGTGSARLAAPGAAYDEHVRLEEEALAGGRGEALLAYWQERLAGLPALELALDRPRPAVQTYRGDSRRLRLPGELAAALRAGSRERHGTLFMTLVAAFQALLCRHTGQEDLALGTPRAGRSHAQLAGTVGYSVNQVVLRGDLAGDPTFAQLFDRTRETVLAAFEHGEIPLPLLVEHLQPVRDASRTPLFQVSFVLQKETRGAEGLTAFALGEEGVAVGPTDFRLESLSLPRQPAPFDLVLHAVERQGGLSFALQYNADLFDGTTAERLLGHLANLLASVAADPGRRLSELHLLDTAEERLLLIDLNRAERTWARPGAVHELFMAQAERTPDKPAAVGPRGALTYRDLDERSTALAVRIQEAADARPDGRIALLADPDPDVLVGMLGILKSGCGFVPVDPRSPDERLAWILEDCGCAVVVAQRRSVERVAGIAHCRVLCLDDLEPAGAGPLERLDDPRALAYVVYTSGSTGKPKGVQVSHESLVPILRWGCAELGLGEHSRVLQSLSFFFDFGIFEQLTTVLAGGTLFFPGEGDPAGFAQEIERHRINTLHTTPAFARELVAVGAGLDGLEIVHLGGEALSWDTVARIRKAAPRAAVFNGYGPTEATVNSSIYQVGAGESGWPLAPTVPIGKRSADNALYVLDRWGGLAPFGARGELAVGGIGVARGYLNRPELTAERFVPDPFGAAPGGRLYRTGDLVRYLSEGDIEFLGRIDQQVKLRGLRIEPGEIEAALLAHPLVREAVVAVLPPGRLVAYLVGGEGGAPSSRELQEHLRARLPISMVPSAYVSLPALPLTPNGKIDRKALPVPEAEPSGSWRPPGTPAEELLAGIFAEVLETDPIGAEDGFFDLGGHSLAAMRLLARVRQLFGVDLPLSRVFEAPTVAALARAVEGAARSGVPPLERVERDGRLPLSFAQQRLWFLDQMEPASPLYNIPAAIHLRGHLSPLDPAALAAALSEVVRRHEALRTRFVAAAGRPVQAVDPPASVPLPAVDLAALPADRRLGEARRLARAEALRPFDLARGPLLRAALLRTVNEPMKEEQVLLLTLHHIVSDGWSLRVLARELGEIYGAFAAGRPSPLPDLDVQYADYAVWQRRWLQGEVLAAELAHWRTRLADAPPVLDLPLDRPRTAAAGHRGASRALSLPPDLLPALRRLARQQGGTLFMAALAAFQVLLSRVCGTEDVSVGTPVAGRGQIRTEGLIGFFVNTLVLRTDLSGEPPFAGLLERVREVALAAYAHQDLPFEKLVEELRPHLGDLGDVGDTPLFQVFFTLDAEPPPSLRLGSEVEAAVWPLEPEIEKFDLSLTLAVVDEGLSGALGFRTALFDGATVERLAGAFVRLLAGAAADPGLRLSELPLLSAAERRQLLAEWNDAAALPPSDTTLHGLFAAQAARTPEAVALVLGSTGERWSYRELDLWSDGLARRLAGLGVGPEVRVGVCLPRTPLLVATLLGVLKAGGAYVPLDPEYPRERLDFLVEDSGAAVVVREDLTPDPSPIALPPPGRGAPPPAQALPGNLAYLIYTSGSTGRPKGVAIEHRSAVAFARWARTVFAPEELAGVLAATSVSFDLSVFELFVTLAWGGKVVLAANALELPRLAAAGEVVLVNTVPSAMAELVRQRGVPASVRTVNLAGEPLKRSLAEAIYMSSAVSRVLDLYGPSEATTYSTWAAVARGERREPAIGRPVAGTRVVLLGRSGAPVPAGVPGELFLGGAGLARGYFNRPDLTAERFVPDPFAAEAGAEPGGRLYRTGDLARFLPDGRLDYLGRIDQQVKVRGFRIELGEIEAALLAHGAVQAAAVLAREDLPGGMGLAAYVVAHPPSSGPLRDFLRERLPDFMVPAAFVFLESLPLTPNGKVDRKALASFTTLALEREADRTGAAPRTPTEELVAGIFAEVLGLERVDVEESFFALGGHSLLATQVTARLRAVFGVDLPVRAVFETPTVAGLAGRLEGSARERAAPIPRVSRQEPLPLSFAQQRLWFLDQLEPGSPLYNLPAAVTLTGRLDGGALAAALGEVVRRHEALRTTFPAVAGTPVQRVAEPAGLAVPQIDLRGLPGSERAAEESRLTMAEARRPFDLARGPLLRSALLKLGAERHTLLVTIHHIVSDGWSMGVLVREIGALYTAFAAGRPSPLPELALQYADFAVWQRRHLAGEALDAELAWWREQLAGMSPALELPTDHPRPAERGTRGAVHDFVLEGEGFSALSRRQGVTLFMLLLAGFAGLLQRFTGEEDLVVGTPVAGRTRVETEPLIGFFVNTLVLRLGLSGSPSFLDLLDRVRETALAAYAHQEVPFERLVEELAPERDRSRPPLVQVLFALQNTPSDALALPGLELAVAPQATGTAKLELSCVLTASESGLAGTLETDRDLFDRTTAVRLAEGLARFLEAAVTAPETRVSDLPVLAPAERAALLFEWNDTVAPALAASRAPLVHELVAEQARRQPEALAVAASRESLTYGELAARAGSLARFLGRIGVGPEVRVALCAGATVHRVAGSLSVLLAGGAYVLMDPEAPPERLAFLVADSGAAAVLTERSLAGRFASCSVPLIELESGDGAEAGSLPAPSVGPENLAYVVYTSGSTGLPKGVAVSHRGLLNLVRWHQAIYGLSPADRATLIANPAFDAAVWELWPYLAAGASLHMPDDETRFSPQAIVRFWRDAGITWSFLPTPLAEEVIAAGAAPLAGLSLKGLLCGGDRLHRGPGPDVPFALINHYGPSEVSVVSTAAAVPPDIVGAPPIGRPIREVRTFVADAQGALVPRGAAGELWIGGASLARGYLGRPALTAERFVPDPWSGEAGERLYRTGDRVRLAPDGALEFLGRIDHQIKLRGFRIEPGEIEAALREHPAVSEAAVTVLAQRLVAYVAYAADTGERAPSGGELRDFLRQRLPGPLVPASYVTLAALPLTPNGKLDRKALPDPRLADGQADAGSASTPPRTPVEERVAAIFAEVLGMARVGVEDDFFALGGHSLLAAQVAARVRSAFGVELPVRSVFETPTVEGLAAWVERSTGEDRSAAPAVVRVSREQPLALSFAQQRLWFLERIEPGAPFFHLPAALDCQGLLDPAALARSVGEILRRHEVLRTRFAVIERRPVQIPMAPAELAAAPLLPCIDLSAVSGIPAGEAEIERLTAAEARRPFDLERGPLLHAVLVRRGPESHRLLLTVHHAAADAWSVGLLIRELGQLYAAFNEGRPSPLPDLAVQYADFAAWQRDRLRGGRLDRLLGFWTGRLARLPTLELPTDRPRPPLQSHRGAHRPVRLDAGAVAGMRRLAGPAGATLFMAVLAVFQAVLARHSGQEDVAVGTAVAERPDPQLEGVIGLFLNTLVLRSDLSGDPAFRELLGRVQEVVLGALAHAELPFEQLVEAVQPERDLSRSPLFQVFFALRNEPLPALDLPGLALRPADTSARAAQFDLSLHLEESGGGLAGWIEYNPDLFDGPTVERLALHCGILLAGAVADPDGRLSALPLLSGPERAQLVAEWNDTRSAPGAAACIHEMFGAQVERTPDAVAAIDAEVSVTYRELADRASRLAEHLIRLGVRPGDRVGVCVERSVPMLFSLLGVLQAGAAYVPLDPAYPQARLAAMLEDSQAAALVASAKTGALLRHPRTLAPEAEEGAGRIAPQVLPEVLGEAPAYVIYTSGSTGVPKGVVVSHRNAVRFFAAMDRELRPDGPGVWLAVTSICFDISVLELLWTLTRGFRVVIHDERAAEGAARASITEQIARHGVSHFQCTPSLAGMLSATPERLQGLAPLSRLLLGGEALPGPLAARLCGTVGGEVRNLYGPTETTVWSLGERVEGGEARPLIGRPIANTEVYLLDASLRPVPLGSPGEVFLGGEGVAQGYWRRPDLTAERFLPDPLGDRPGGRLYRTGDLARHRPDGRLDFIGRTDHQVKVRGVRMELGEVEAALRAHPAVAQAAAVVREGRLIAYLVPAAGGAGGIDLAAGELRRFLAARLPEAMIPSAFVPLAALPLTQNGKVNRKALPAPEAGRLRPDSTYAAPRTPGEKTLAAIWQEVLGQGPIGVDDNFFELGGSSLLLVEIESRLREAFGREIPIVEMFRNPTIRSLAQALEARNRQPARSVETLRPQDGEALDEGSAVDRQRQFLEEMKRRRTQQRRPGR